MWEAEHTYGKMEGFADVTLKFFIDINEIHYGCNEHLKTDFLTLLSSAWVGGQKVVFSHLCVPLILSPV